MNKKRHLIILLLLFTFLLKGFGQQKEKLITINFSNISLVDAIKQLEKASSYTFFYDPTQIDVNQKVDLNVKNASIQSTVNGLLKKTNIDYEVTNTQIALFVKKPSKQVNKGKSSIKGIIADLSGIPIIGVNVIEEGTTNGVVTDLEGNFSLTVKEGSNLVVSYIGFQTLKVKATPTMSIQLKEDSELLQEIVVVGFGTQKKVNLTGAVASVSSDVIANKPVANIGQALQGVVPNLNVSATSASPNSVPTFNVRGGTSIAQNSKGGWDIKNGSPLILVDGVQVDETYLSMINASDIENISLLKDASSAAIYGARATYGVLLVSTKTGKREQKANVTYNFNMQWNTPSHQPDIMDAYTIQLATNQLKKLTGGTVVSWDETLLAAKKAWRDDPQNSPAWIYREGSTTRFDWVRSMNPYDEAVRDWTPMQKHTLSITGGTAKTRFYVSLGYQRQEGMYKINTDVQNLFNGIVNLNTEINKWFQVSTKISYNSSSFDEPYLNPQKGSLWAGMMGETARNICMPIKTSATDPTPNTWTDNILGWLAYGATSETKRTNAVFNVTPTITLLPGWTVKGEFSYRPTEYYHKNVKPTREYLVDDWTSIVKTHTDPSNIVEEVSHSDFYTINAYTNFDRSFGKHNFGAVLGFNQEWYTYRYTSAEAEGILNDQLPVINSATGNQYAHDGLEHWAIRGGFGRLNYNFDGRYLLEFNGRYDGTSRFPKTDRFKFFPSFSGGWRVSEEHFMKNSRKWLDNLKVRASWGSLGNQNVDNYAYIASYGSVGYVPWNMDGKRPMGISPSGLVSPSLTWETATTIDFGVDATFLNNRLDFSFDWYSRQTKDILMAGDKYPGVLGTSAPKKNSGILNTKGWELSLKWQDKLSNGIRYDVSFVLSDYLTKVKRFNGNPNKSLSTLYDGKVMGEIWGYKCLGILQAEDFDINENGKYLLKGPSQTDLASTWYPGDLRFADLGGTKGDDSHNSNVGPDNKVSTGENTVYNSGDLRVIGNSTPRFRFGLDGNIHWKDFSLNLFFQGVAKRDVFISDSMMFGGSDSAGNNKTFKNSWTPEQTNAKYHTYARGQNLVANTRYLYNGAFVRLKTLSLGYNLPKAWLQKISLNSLRINISGYNLFEISKLPSVFDPESITSAYPMMRSVACGVQINF